MRTIRLALAALELLAALNALGGGVYALGGAEGVPREWLDGTPFGAYTIPGIVLLVGAGVMTVAAALLIGRVSWAPSVSVAAGTLLTVWIVVQVALIGYVSWMQPTSFVAGVVVIALAVLVRRGERTSRPRPASVATPS
jgi:hypothetical protein